MDNYRERPICQELIKKVFTIFECFENEQIDLVEELEDQKNATIYLFQILRAVLRHSKYCEEYFLLFLQIKFFLSNQKVTIVYQAELAADTD